MNTIELKTGLTAFVIFLLGLGVGFLLDRPSEKIVEVRDTVKASDTVESSYLQNQVKACQKVVDIDARAFNNASDVMGLFSEAITAVQQSDVVTIENITDQIISYNAQLDDLNAQKQVILADCMGPDSSI